MAAGHLKTPLAELMPDKASLFRPLYFRSTMLQPIACFIDFQLMGWVRSNFAIEAVTGLHIQEGAPEPWGGQIHGEVLPGSGAKLSEAF